MRAVRILIFALVALVAIALHAAPLPAQSSGAAKKTSTATRPELQKRPSGRLEQTKQPDRESVQIRSTRQGERSVPRGWCIGRGNPHNTPENCGPNARTLRLDHDFRHYERTRNRRVSGFERQHLDFHRQLEAECQQRLARRPNDRNWQRSVRAECEQRHERWHLRNDPRYQRTR